MCSTFSIETPFNYSEISLVLYCVAFSFVVLCVHFLDFASHIFLFWTFWFWWSLCDTRFRKDLIMSCNIFSTTSASSVCMLNFCIFRLTFVSLILYIISFSCFSDLVWFLLMCLCLCECLPCVHVPMEARREPLVPLTWVPVKELLSPDEQEELCTPEHLSRPLLSYLHRL